MPYTILKVPHAGNETEVVGEFADEAEAKERLEELRQETAAGEQEYSLEPPPSVDG